MKLYHILSALRSQIGPKSGYSRSDRTGASDTSIRWDEPGLLGGISGWSELGGLVLGGAPATRWYFSSVSCAASQVAGGGGGGAGLGGGVGGGGDY